MHTVRYLGGVPVVLSGSSDSSSSLSFSSCLAIGWVSHLLGALPQQPLSKSPDRTPLPPYARLSPARTPGRMTPGTAHTWQWWCGNGNSQRARSVECPSDPSSHLRAAAPGCAPPQCARHSLPPESWWRKGPSLQGRAEQGVGAEAEGREEGLNSLCPFLLSKL